MRNPERSIESRGVLFSVLAAWQREGPGLQKGFAQSLVFPATPSCAQDWIFLNLRLRPTQGFCHGEGREKYFEKLSRQSFLPRMPCVVCSATLIHELPVVAV